MPGHKSNYSIAREVGARVKSRRLAKRMSQRDLGFASALDNSMVSRYESGEYCPSLDSLCSLAVVLARGRARLRGG